MDKNRAGQKFVVFAFNRTTNLLLTGDAANITANLQIDFGSASPTNDANPTELQVGFYAFDALQAETNGNTLIVYPSSSTPDIQVIAVPGVIYTTPVSFSDDIIQTADHTASIEAVPTVAEFNARTLVAANYSTANSLSTAQLDLDKITGDDGVTLATSQTLYAPAKEGDNMNVSSIGNNVITALSISPSALNGKGNWNIGKTDYSISGTINTLDGLNNFNPSSDLVSLEVDQSGVTIGTVNNVTGLVAGSGGISVAADSFVLITGDTPTNDFSDTVSENGIYHIVPDLAGTTDGYYGFNVGTSGIPQTVTWLGYAQGNADSYAISAYNFTTTNYDQVGTVNGTNGVTPLTKTFDLLTSHVGKGAEAGEVRLRFNSSDGSAFATNRIFCTHTESALGIPNGSTITLSAPATNQTFSGHNWAMDFNGQIVSGAYLSQATSVIGTGLIANGNSMTLQQCNLGTVSLDAFIFLENCSLSDTLTLTSTSGGDEDKVHINNSNSAVSGILTPTVDASAVTKTTSLHSRKWGGGCIYHINAFVTLSHESTVGGAINVTNAGGLAEVRGEITNITVNSSLTATTNITITSGGPITINGTGGTVNVFGLHGGITDNSSGSVTINDNGIDMIAIQNVTNSIAIHAGMAQAGTINTITLDAGASSLDGAYDPSSVRIIEGTGKGQTRLALQYDGTTKVLVVDRNWKVTPDGTSQFTINSDAGREHVNEGLAQGGTNNTIILNALASSQDDVYLGQICFIRSGLGDDQTGTCIAYNGTTKVLTLDKDWKVNPDNTSAYAMLPASPVLLTDATETKLDGIAANAAAIGNLNNLSLSQVLTTQLTESYAADGIAPTLSQLLFLVQQVLTDFEISGTALAIKKLDGVTTAATLTLNDASDPTGHTRSS